MRYAFGDGDRTHTFEVFHASTATISAWVKQGLLETQGPLYEAAGYYWRGVEMGLPQGQLVGPFNSYHAAYASARVSIEDNV